MKKLTFYLFTVITLTSMFSSCKKDDSQIAGNLRYTEKISGSQKTAAGATVYIMTDEKTYLQKTTADDAGNYIFHTVDDGTYWIEAEYQGMFFDYTAKSKTFSVKGDDNETIDLTLTNSQNSIYGYAYINNTSTVLTNQEIDLYYASDTSYSKVIKTATTNDKGFFSFNGLEDGKYNIDAYYVNNGTDYYDYAENISVVGGEAKEADLTLTSDKKRK